ncbi:hypothetical protein [Mesorhizobium sp. KR9-304]|uniref:hypothetical protein n=1 Tax=Mesorhizobium sp. KR9-304 TaxID=3156614 RepID=UPI0032B31EC1
MRIQLKFAILIALAGFGSGCLNDANRRADGLTDGAGNASASNSVMQMVDPWQFGVQDTRLLVPAARSTASASAADDAADAKTSQTTSGSGN